MSGPWEKYQQAPADGPWAKYASPSPAATHAEPGFVDNLKEGATNLVKGMSSGVADLGDTILSGLAASAKPGAAIPAVSLPLALVDAVTGGAITHGDKDRSDSLEQFNKDNKDSTAFTVGRVAGNVLGTSGTGALLGTAAKGAGAAPAVVEALTTGGLKAGGMAGAKGLALRAAGGAANGAAAAGLVSGDPLTTVKGAAAGAALPVAVKGAGEVAHAAGRAIGGSASPVADASQRLAVARSGAAQGYVVPPVDLQPGLATRLLSGLSGKIKTSQVASERNQNVTDKLARRALGVDDAAELNADVLQELRQKAGAAYQAVRGAGQVTADPTLLGRLDQIASVSKGASRSFPGLPQNGVDDLVAAVRQPTFDAGDAIDATMLLRETADKAFRQGDNTLGRAAKGAATALEDQLERHLTAAGNPDAVKAFQAARQQIAKTYSVQGALNPSTGSVSAPKLAKDLAKSKPLSGELRQIAEFSTAFPKATQALKEAPGTVSPLDWFWASTAGLGSASTPVGAATLIARPLARAALLSGPAQRAALREPAPGVIARAVNSALPLSGRVLPVLPANRE